MNKQTISGIIYTALKKRFSSSQIQRALKKAGQETIDIIRERTQAGIGVDGKRIPVLTKKYEYRKRTKLSSLLRGKETTDWAAKKTPAHIRLTGQTFSDMNFKLLRYAPVGQGSSSIAYQIYILKRSKDKIDWLASETGGVRTKKEIRTYKKASRKFWGLSTNATRREKEETRIAQVFAKALGTKSVGFKGKVT